jgi:hypothetical protein
LPVRFARENELLRIILEGDIAIEDMYAGVDEIYASDEQPRIILWDSRGANTTLTTGDSADLLKTFSEYAVERGKDRANSRVALLSSADIHFGISRMSTAYAEQNNAAYNMQVFRDETEAIAWLNSESDAD